MKKLIIFAAVVALSSCGKKIANLRYTCTSNNPYTILLDGVNKGTVPPKSFVDLNVPIGTHVVKATQNSGYLLFPTVVEKSINVPAAGAEFIFP
jgi:hypothetical protein